MKRYETISAGELRKMHGKKCRLETDTGVIIEDGIISVDDNGGVGVTHNNSKENGSKPKEMFGKKYGTFLYVNCESDTKKDNVQYQWIEIEETKKEGDLVYVSDESEEHALRVKLKRILHKICKDGYVCIAKNDEDKYKEGKTFSIVIWKYAVPVPKEKTLTIKTEDGQSLEISEEKARELGFNF